MAQYYWGEVSKHYEKIDPLKLSGIVLDLYKDDKVLFDENDEPLKALAEASKIKPSEVWSRVADALLRKDRVSYRVLLGLRRWYVRIFDAKSLLEWAEKHKPEGPQLLGALTSQSGVPLDELSRQLLIRYGEDERVCNHLYANFHTGGFTGSMTAWLKSKLEDVEKWAGDSEPAVAKWARALVRSLNDQIAEFQKREEEEDLI